MKVLSLTEPYATLIKEKKKSIETRSWKTNYRGELYIHASKTKVAKENKENTELMQLVEEDLNFGNIICKCKLVDCIYMTKEYVENMKKKNHQEYICGEYKEGRYAWILEDIKVLEIPIKAKGQLNIWNYYNEFEVMDLMEEIEYGWLGKRGEYHRFIDTSFSDNYVLPSPSEVIKNKVGICWDQVELERYYFKGNDWNIKTYFLVHYDGAMCPAHTFLTYKKGNKFYWFEHSWELCRGIHEYKTLKELLLDVREKFIAYELNGQYREDCLHLHEYEKPKYHISVQAFYKHCENGKYIHLKEL